MCFGVSGHVKSISYPSIKCAFKPAAMYVG